MLQESAYIILNKIDHKYCTRETSNTQTILDHKHIYLEIHKYKPEKIKKTVYEAIDYNKLNETVKRCLPDYYELKFEELETKLLDAVNVSKFRKTKIQNLPRPDWINRDILAAIDEKNRLWCSYLKKPPSEAIA